VEARASRRIAERGLDPGGEEAELVRRQLRARDEQDRNRAVAPLRPAEDAVHIANDGTFESAVERVVAAVAAAERGRAA
jgi:cytidylate kinase